MNLLQPQRLNALARAYALGTLQGGARRRFERLLRRSPAARDLTLEWQEQFATLAVALPPLQPREQVWRQIEQRLGLKGAAAARASWWTRWFSPRLWAGALAGALAGVIVSTVLLQANPGWLGHEPISEALPPSYVGVLSDAEGRPTVLLSSRRHGRVLTAKMLRPLTPPADQAALLWAFPKGGGAPFLVGRLPASGSATIPLADTSEKLFFNVERLGASFEPAAQTPAAPGGPLVVVGPCVKLW
jgi:anti-sigma-K factor RskA